MAPLKTLPKVKVEKLVLAKLRGFCAGVVRAIDVVEKALEVCGKPVYVRHEIIHNRYVVEDLREKGAIFVEELRDVPNGAWLSTSTALASLPLRPEPYRYRRGANETALR